jgi:hypothetical protein
MTTVVEPRRYGAVAGQMKQADAERWPPVNPTTAGDGATHYFARRRSAAWPRVGGCPGRRMRRRSRSAVAGGRER